MYNFIIIININWLMISTGVGWTIWGGGGEGVGVGLSVADAVHEEGDVSLDVCREVLHGHEELRSGGDVDGAKHLEVQELVAHDGMVFVADGSAFAESS